MLPASYVVWCRPKRMAISSTQGEELGALEWVSHRTQEGEGVIDGLVLRWPLLLGPRVHVTWHESAVGAVSISPFSLLPTRILDDEGSPVASTVSSLLARLRSEFWVNGVDGSKYAHIRRFDRTFKSWISSEYAAHIRVPENAGYPDPLLWLAVLAVLYAKSVPESS